MSTLSQFYAVAPEAEGVDPSLVGQGYGPYARKPNTMGRMSRQGTEETISWIIKTENYPDAVDVIAGVVESVVILGTVVTRIIPMKHPDFPALLAEDIVWRHMGEGGSTFGGYTHTRLDVTFRTQNYQTSGPLAYVEPIATPSQRSVPTPSAAWTVGGDPVFRDPDYSVGGSDIKLIMHHCPPIDNGTLNVYARYVNDDPFLGNPRGCVLYHGGEQIPQSSISTAGQRVILSFSATTPEYPWNYFSKADGSLALLSRSSGTIFRHPFINFASNIIV